MWFHNGGLLEFTATVDYQADRDLIKEALADRLKHSSAELGIGSICPATRKVLFTLGLLYIDSCSRGAWPEDTDRDIFLSAVQLPMCSHDRALVPRTTAVASYMEHYLLADFGKFFKTVVFGLPLLKYEYQRHLSDTEPGTSTAQSGNNAGDGPLCRPSRCNHSDLYPSSADESAFLKSGGNTISIIFGAQCGECGSVMPISPMLPPQQMVAEGCPYYCSECHSMQDRVGLFRSGADYRRSLCS